MKCVVCGREISWDEGYFEEMGKAYCEKCYANKRWDEVDVETRRKWREQIRNIWVRWINEATDEEEKKKRREYVIKHKIPKTLERELE